MSRSYVLLVCILISLMCVGTDLHAQQEGKISLDIKGMDVIDVLKILAMRSNLNIVAGKNVRGKVTVFLKDVEVMDALEIILAANDLAYEKKGDILNVMTEREYEALYGERSYSKKQVKIIRLQYAKAVEAGKSLNQIKSKIGKVVVDEASNTVVLMDVPGKINELQEAIESMDLPTETQTFVLNYAKAEDLEEKLKESLTKDVGELKIDERMNKIVVTDLPKKMEYIRNLINDFDERDRVVLIEAKIIQITLNEDLSYGINWNNVFAGIDTIASADLTVSLPSDISAWPTTFTYTRAHGATEHGDQDILRVLERLGKTNVLSTPRITVANNEEAKVLVGTKKAYVTSTITQSDGTTTTADNVEFVDVGVRLAVTPTISRDGYITMKIKPEVSSAPTTLELTNSDGSVRTSVPIVSTSEAETQLLVKNGSTIIMAGLMKDTRTDNSEKIPWLGDIPVLGHLFSSRGKGNEKTELVIFLTPHIIEEGKDDSAEAQAYLYHHEGVGLRPKDGPVYIPQPEEVKLKEEIGFVSSEITVAPKDFQGYCDYVSDRINQFLHKHSSLEAQKQEIRLSFILRSNGTLKGSPQVLNATDKRIRDLVIRSVEEATPFFPFPGDYTQAEETFQLTIYFEGF